MTSIKCPKCGELNGVDGLNDSWMPAKCQKCGVSFQYKHDTSKWLTRL